MAQESYDIKVVFDGRWKVDLNGRKYGPFPNEKAATEAATAGAAKAAAKGIDASVSVPPG